MIDFNVRKTLLFILLMISGSALFAQQLHISNNGYFKIKGRILDAALKQPIEYATISLIDSATKKTVTGEIADKKGNFSLPKVRPGSYSILFQFLGYADFTRKIAVKQDIVMNDVLLEKKTYDMENVTVTGKRQIIDYKLDKMVYNLDKDITSQGGVITDALKKIPGVTVDIDGNVELLGNPSIKFLIDGKPSVLFGNNVADALQSIPNSQIQSIEVITSPSAKYDASGTGGIINIILKKSNMEGFNGNINLAAGTRLENGSINTNYKHGNRGISTYFSGNAQLTSTTPNGMDRITSTGTQRLLQDAVSDMNRNGYKGGISAEWSLSKTETIAASVGFNHFGAYNTGITNQNSIQYDTVGLLLNNTASTRNADNKFNFTDFENSLSYRKKFKKKGEELELAYNGSFGNNTTSYNQLQYYTGNSNAFAGSHSLNPGKENEVNLELNYVYPFKKDIELETGVRTTFESIISNADVFTLNATANSFAKDSSQSYSSDYKRTVYAGYASLHIPLTEKMDVKVGARYEYTVNKANYSNAPNASIPDYSNLAPSFIMSYKLDARQNIKLAYSYRIERPDFRDLNPFMNLADPHNITTGNPNLHPEIGNKVELGYNNFFDDGSSINITAYYQRNSPDIKPYVTYYAAYRIGDSSYTDVTITTRETISAEVRTGVNVAGTIPVGKKITLRPNFQVFDRHLNNPNATPAITSALGLRLNLNTSLQLSKSLAVEIFGNYNKGMRWQGKQADVYSYTFAIRKQLYGNKASIGLIAVNPLNKYISQKSQQLTEQFTSNIYKNVPYRSFGLTFTYKFGKMKTTKAKDTDNSNYIPPSDSN